jgi:hypothetical protein
MKEPAKLVSPIGDIVHNRRTHEQAKIIRIVNADVQRAAASRKEAGRTMVGPQGFEPWTNGL